MATVTPYSGGSQFNDTDNTNRSVTITTVTGDLPILVIAASGMAGSWTSVVVTDSQGGSYVDITGARSTNTGGGGDDTLASIWVRTALVATGASCTVTADFTTNAVTHSGASLAAHQVTGMAKAGTSAVWQAGAVSAQAPATPTVTMSSAFLTGNAGLGYVVNKTNPATLTPRASWTESFDGGYATPLIGLETMSRNNGETASSIQWGGASASGFGAGVIELDTTSATTMAGTGSITFAGTSSLTVTAASPFTRVIFDGPLSADDRKTLRGSGLYRQAGILGGRYE